MKSVKSLYNEIEFVKSEIKRSSVEDSSDIADHLLYGLELIAGDIETDMDALEGNLSECGEELEDLKETLDSIHEKIIDVIIEIKKGNYEKAINNAETIKDWTFEFSSSPYKKLSQ